jgi:hypothetical protein
MKISSLNKGLIGHWKFDGNAKDNTPYNNNGTVVGATLTTDRYNGSNKAYSFNGTSSNIALLRELFTASNATYTVSFWAKWGNATARRTVLSWGNLGARFFVSHQADVNGKLVIGHGNSTIIPDVAYGPTEGVWDFWTISNELYTTKFYKNGSLINTVTHTDTGIISTGFPIRIGQQYQAFGEYFTGSLDDVRIYNRILTATEVTQLYNIYGGDYLC